MRDYKSVVMKVVEELYKALSEEEPGFAKEIFKELFKEICRIVKYHNENFECAINNITVVLATAIVTVTYENEDKDSTLKTPVEKLDSIMEIIYDFYPYPEDASAGTEE